MIEQSSTWIVFLKENVQYYKSVYDNFKIKVTILSFINITVLIQRNAFETNGDVFHRDSRKEREGSDKERERERKRECVSVCTWERERVCVCLWMCACRVCVFDLERDREWVCVKEKVGERESMKGVRKIVVDSFQSRLHSLSLFAKEKEKKTLSDCFFLAKWHKLREKSNRINPYGRPILKYFKHLKRECLQFNLKLFWHNKVKRIVIQVIFRIKRYFIEVSVLKI